MRIQTNYFDTFDGKNSVIYNAGFVVKGMQFNNITDSNIKVYLGAISLGAGGRLPDYIVPAFTFVQLPFYGNEMKVTIEYSDSTKQYDLVRVDIIDEETRYYVATTPPTGGIGLAQNVALTNALIAGTNHIGQVGIDATNTTIDFTTNGAAITGQALDSGGSGVLGWLSQIVKAIKSTLTVSISAALPAGDNNIGNVDVLTLPTTPAGVNHIGGVNIDNIPHVVVDTLPSLPAGANDIGKVVITSMPPVTTTSTAIRQSHEMFDVILAANTVYSYDMGARDVNVIIYLTNDDNTYDLFVSFDTTPVTSRPLPTGSVLEGVSGQNTCIRLKPGESLTDLGRKCNKINLISDGGIRSRFMGV